MVILMNSKGLHSFLLVLFFFILRQRSVALYLAFRSKNKAFYLFIIFFLATFATLMIYVFRAHLFIASKTDSPLLGGYFVCGVCN